MFNFCQHATGKVFTAAGLKQTTGYDPAFEMDKVRRAGYGLVFCQRPNVNEGLFEIVPRETLRREGDDYYCGFDCKSRPLPEAKQNLKDQATAKRWEVLNGGLRVQNVGVFTTNDLDQLRITGANVGSAIAKKVMSFDRPIDFKSAAGWITINAGDLEMIGALVFIFGQDCFSHERRLHEQIDAATSVMELAKIDLNAGWPAGAIALEEKENDISA